MTIISIQERKVYNPINVTGSNNPLKVEKILIAEVILFLKKRANLIDLRSIGEITTRTLRKDVQDVNLHEIAEIVKRCKPGKEKRYIRLRLDVSDGFKKYATTEEIINRIVSISLLSKSEIKNRSFGSQTMDLSIGRSLRYVKDEDILKKLLELAKNPLALYTRIRTLNWKHSVNKQLWGWDYTTIAVLSLWQTT
jgi:hypothetical protein